MAGIVNIYAGIGALLEIKNSIKNIKIVARYNLKYLILNLKLLLIKNK